MEADVCEANFSPERAVSDALATVQSSSPNCKLLPTRTFTRYRTGACQAGDKSLRWMQGIQQPSRVFCTCPRTRVIRVGHVLSTCFALFPCSGYLCVECAARHDEDHAIGGHSWPCLYHVLIPSLSLLVPCCLSNSGFSVSHLLPVVVVGGGYYPLKRPWDASKICC